MKGKIRGLMVVLGAATSMFTPMAAAAAHGEKDARVITRNAELGPYMVSLWSVVGDTASDLPAHIIVMVEGTPISEDSMVVVVGGGRELTASPSATVAGAWETGGVLAPGDDLVLKVESAAGQWTSEAFAVPGMPEAGLAGRLVGSLAIVATAAAVYWLLARTVRVWRRPAAVGVQG